MNMIWIKDGDVIWKNELLNSKADESNENIYTNMNNFMDYVYQKDLYQYTNDIYDDNAIKEKLKRLLI